MTEKFLNMKLFYEYTLVSKTGEVIKHEADEAHSFVQGFLLMLYRWWVENMTAGPIAIVTSGAEDTDIPSWSNHFDILGPINNANYGPVVGTSSTAVAIDDYALGAKIGHGTGSGALQYSVTTYTAPTYDATSTRFVITRDYTNASGSPITVTEIGLISSSGGYILIARDILSVPVTVNNSEKLVLNYTIQTEL